MFDINADGAPLFAVHMAGDEWGTTDFAQDLYNYVEEKFAEPIQNDSEVVIDADWAMEILCSLEE